MESNKNKSAGLLMYQIFEKEIKYLLVHPTCGEKHCRKQVWGIPKGLIDEGEDAFTTAVREFKEETGIEPKEPYLDLGSVKQKSGKTVYAWAFEGKFDGKINCTSMVTLTNKQGKEYTIPEVDKGDMFTREEAKSIIISAQIELIERLEALILNTKI
jgi:predicted NUDIX family NTP pyrophosphohydrolase